MWAHPVEAAEGPRSNRLLLWVLGGFGLVGMLCCGGLFAAVVYVGVVSPETSVYTSNQVPHRFVSVAEEVGGLEGDEKIQFFYSDAVLNVRDGFYYVSDRKVAVYINDGREEPLQVIPFGQIVDVRLDRDDSFFVDSQLTLVLENGEVVSFPVSSEYDRDEDFADAIRRGMSQSKNE